MFSVNLVRRQFYTNALHPGHTGTAAKPHLKQFYMCLERDDEFKQGNGSKGSFLCQTKDNEARECKEDIVSPMLSLATLFVDYIRLND